MVAPVILVEASPFNPADGSVATVRLAGGGARVPYSYGGYNDWRAGITGLPTFIASLEFAGGEFPSGSIPSAAEIVWAPSTRADLATIASLMWIDALITVRIGAEGAALLAVVLSGSVLDATVENGQLKLSLADPATKIKKPLLTTRYAGTGGLEGPVEWQGLIRKRVFGRVWNLRAEPIDKANNVYALADPTRPIQSIDAVRDKGAAAVALTTLAWAGSVAATFAALQAAAVPAGGGVICPSIACIKWWTQPAGDLCADLKGEVGAGYVETTAEIAKLLVDAIGGPAFTAGTVAAAAAARPAPVGWLAKDDTTTVAAMLDELFGNSSLIWLLNGAGEIVIRQWTFGASVATATSQDVTRKKQLRPVATRKIGYQRNELQMNRGDLAAIVLAADVSGLGALATSALTAAQVTNANVAVATGNRVPFSQFEAGVTPWFISAFGSTYGGALAVAASGAYQDLVFTCTFTATGQYQSVVSGWFTVTAGEQLAIQSRLSTNGNCTAIFCLEFSTGAVPQVLPTAGISTPADYLFQGMYTVPAGATTARLVAFVNSIGASAARFTLAQPMVAGAASGQTAYPAFVPGPNAYNAADVTAANTAAAIAGQAPAATDATIEGGADVTSAIVGVANIDVAADYTGAITDALPRVVQFKFMRQAVDLTTSAAWSVSVISGTVSASIGAATGLLSLNTSGGSMTNAVLQLTATYGATTRTARVTLSVNNALPPSGGSSGGTSSSSGFSGTINSTTMTAIGPELSITVGSGGSAALHADYTFTMTSGSGGLVAQWYWWNGSAYVALGSSVASTDNAISSDGTPGDGVINVTDTGRTALSTQKYRLYAKTSAGSVARSVTGTVSAVGS